MMTPREWAEAKKEWVLNPNNFKHEAADQLCPFHENTHSFLICVTFALY